MSARARIWFAKAAALLGLTPPVSAERLALELELAEFEADHEVFEASPVGVESESNAPPTGDLGLDQYGPRQKWGPAEPEVDADGTFDFAGQLARIEHLLEDVRNLLAASLTPESSLAVDASDSAPPGQPHHAQGGAGVGGSAPPLPVLGGADPFNEAAAADERVIGRLNDFRDKRG